jgi:hypothetical protein
LHSNGHLLNITHAGRSHSTIYKGIFFDICPLLSADDVNLLGDNTDSIRKNAEPVTDASKEVALEINIEKTKYKLLTRHQNAG